LSSLSSGSNIVGQPDKIRPVRRRKEERRKEGEDRGKTRGGERETSLFLY
jgi:hypothetical protein